MTTGLQEATQVASLVVKAVISRQPFINDVVFVGDQAMPFAKGFEKTFLSLQAHPLDLLDRGSPLVTEGNPDLWFRFVDRLYSAVRPV